MAKNGVLPPQIQSTVDWLSSSSGSGGTQIKQADQMMHPGGDDVSLGIFQKSRLAPSLFSEHGYAMYREIKSGRYKPGDIETKGCSSLFARMLAGTIVTYPSGGEGRKEIVQVLQSMAPAKARFPRMSGRGQGYDSDGFDG